MMYKSNKAARGNNVNKIARQLNAFWLSPFGYDSVGDISNSVFKQLGNRWGYELNTPGFFRDADGYTLSLEVPGHKKEDIEVRVDPTNHTLGIVVKDYTVVTGDEKEGEEPRLEQQYATRIPQEADVSKDPKAKLELGILSITFPENEATKPRIIEVTVE